MKEYDVTVTMVIKPDLIMANSYKVVFVLNFLNLKACKTGFYPTFYLTNSCYAERKDSPRSH